MIGKKSSKSKAVAHKDDTDFSVLDDAVSELAKQTEALLGKTGEKMSKPNLPKKTTHHHKAKSFDIIHNPGTKKRTSSVLKSTHPSQKLIESSDEKLIEAVPSSVEVVENSSTMDSSAQVVSGHSSGSLRVNEEVADAPGAVALESVDVEAKEPVVVKKEAEIKPPGTSNIGAVEKSIESSKDSQDEDSDNTATEAELADDAAGDTIDLHDDDPSATELIDELDTRNTSTEAGTDSKEEVKKDETPEESETKGSEIYSDNLKSDPVTFDEDTDEPKVAVFDTEEYHSTLHDWSKLEHHNKAPIVLLLILAIILAVGVYIVVSGISVPIPL